MYRRGLITAENLRVETDEWLREAMKRYLGYYNHFTPLDLAKDFDYLSCKTQDEAMERAREINKGDECIAFTDDFPMRIKPSTDKFFVERDGRGVPFNEVYPHESKAIEDEATFEPEPFVCVIPLNTFSGKPLNVSALREVFSSQSHTSP
jgi:hypothetical protein